MAPRFATLLEFFRTEAAGGAALIVTAIVALLWSNLAPQSYVASRDFRLGFGALAPSVLECVNDGLMVLFFLLVGLEIRREMREGQLATLPQLAAPTVAALGGMVVPAIILAALNWNDPAALRGWAVPIATDIAFSLAVLRVLGRRVPAGLKVFLTALAIIDDLGAIVVIALFYTHDLALAPAGAAVVVWLVMLALNRSGVRMLWPYLVGGFVLWACVAASGVHATLAGVALAFVVPMAEVTAGDASPARRLEHALTNVVAWLVLPLFGLANAGLSFVALPSGLLHNPLVLGVAGGLFIGKQLGVFGATCLACLTGLVRLPANLTWVQVYGASILCGVGFTMSLFIADLSFHGQTSQDEVKLAVFVGSVLSALVALLVLSLAKTNAKPSHSVNGETAQHESVNP